MINGSLLLIMLLLLLLLYCWYTNAITAMNSYILILLLLPLYLYYCCYHCFYCCYCSYWREIIHSVALIRLPEAYGMIREWPSLEGHNPNSTIIIIIILVQPAPVWSGSLGCNSRTLWYSGNNTFHQIQ